MTMEESQEQGIHGVLPQWEEAEEVMEAEERHLTWQLGAAHLGDLRKGREEGVPSGCPPLEELGALVCHEHEMRRRFHSEIWFEPSAWVWWTRGCRLEPSLEQAAVAVAEPAEQWRP